jgi:hypothetical protein
VKKLLLLVTLVAAASSPACGVLERAKTPLEQAREDALSGDADALGRWLLAELVALGGTAKGAKDARAKLEAVKGGGLDAKLALALDDDLHGQAARAFDEFADTLRAASSSGSPSAPLVAIAAMDGFAHLAQLVPRTHRDATLTSLAPVLLHGPESGNGGLGWRAARNLASWVSFAEEQGKAQGTRDSLRRKALGCVEAIRLAGPFEFAPGDDDESPLEGERAGAWPAVFEGRPGASMRPRVVATESSGCNVVASKPPAVGTYLAETFVELDRPQDVVLVANDFTRIAVDDVPVHVRDRTAWGGLLLDGAVVRLTAGRHRIVWRASGFYASLELRGRDGTRLELKASIDPTPPYGGKPPQVLSDPHPALLASRNPHRDPVTTFLAARVALSAGAGDVAAVVLGSPLNDDATVATATGYPAPTLELAGSTALADPIWSTSLASSRARTLYERATELDDRLYAAPLDALALKGEGMQATDKIKALQVLATKHPGRPDATLELIDTYKDLGWTHEHDKLVAELAKRFSDDTSVLRSLLAVLDEHGPLTEADALAERMAKNEPDEPILADRLIGRRDLPKALEAYKTFLAAHPDRKSVRTRIEDIEARLADLDDATKKLAAKIAKGEASPMEEADHLLASGDKRALEKALTHGVRNNGSRSASVLHAMELLQQTVDFAPYRLDARKVIAEHDATHAGKEKAGAAERILDYGVMWVRSDGTSAFLEQEIVRIHSREAIEDLARVKPYSGRALHLRVLKKDGRVLEPLRVAGKPDLTFPDLDVGDAVETEIVSPGVASTSSYISPRWYFAEPRIGYARSEYVVITPKGQELVVETRAGAPQPKLSTLGTFDVRRWRVDDAPPAPEEPDFRAPPDEVLPNVAFGWGIRLEDAVARAAAAMKETTPVDPRVAAVAATIVSGVPADKTAERVRRIYRWVMQNIQKGSERDGRRAVFGKAGDPAAAFRVLARAASVPTYIALAHDRLALPPPSSLSAGEGYRHALVMVSSNEGDLFLSFGGRFVPFGYVPAGSRGEDAIVLRPGAPHVKVPTVGPSDALRASGVLELNGDGDAKGTITLSFSGMMGAVFRESIDRLSQGELHAAVESKLLAAELPGVKLLKIEVVARGDFDAPLGLRCEVEVPSFAHAISGGALVVFAPFQPRLAAYAPRSKRLTPLLLDDPERREVSIDVLLPKGAKVVRGPVHGERAFRKLKVVVADRVDGGTLQLRRTVELSPERIEPTAYGAFQAFCRGSDALGLEETVVSQ